MSEMPTIPTERLLLRPFSLADVSDVAQLAGDREVAATTLNIPHPYEQDTAVSWIASHKGKYRSGEGITLAIEQREKQCLLGAISLMRRQEYDRAEMGYWIGKPYWGNGYGTEAAVALLDYAFNVWELHRVYAWHFESNPASGRIMQKIGMQYEGCLRHHIKKWGRYEDMVCYGILRTEYERMRVEGDHPPPLEHRRKVE